MIAGTFLLTISMIMIAMSKGPVFFMISALVFGTATATNSPTLFAWAIDLSDPKNVARGMATLFIALELGIVGGALLPMELYQNIPERLPLAFFLCAAIALISTV